MVKLRRFIMALAGPYVATVTLAWLMVLVVLGTLAQAEIGLYQAQLKYFSSVILWLGHGYLSLPTPGGGTTLAVLGLGLSLKLILHPWRLAQAGSLLAHLSVWLLLVGSVVTAFTAHEGYLRVAEGQTSNIINSYHTPELAVLDASGLTVLKYPATALKPGAVLAVGEEKILLEAYFPNSQLSERPEPVADGLTLGARRFFNFTAKPPEADDERNRPTVLFTKLNQQGQPLAKLVLFQGQPVAQPIVFKGQTSGTLVLRPAQTLLPFSVKLKHFTQEYYPGTNIPRHYASALEINSPQSGQWPALVQMNTPLRYQGYTLYQASFINPASAGPQESILAVVQNRGYLIPYAAGILLCVGLVLHLMIRWHKLTLLLLALVPWLMLSPSGQAENNLNMAPLAALPIQHEGRIKPLQTFAEVTLEQLHGARKLENINALPWLAELVFNPAQAHTRNLFILPSLALAERLQLPARSPRAYTYPEVSSALRPQFQNLQKIAAIPPKQRDTLDSQLFVLAEQVQIYFLLTQTFHGGSELLKVLPPRLGEEDWLPIATAPATAYRATWLALAEAYRTQDAPLWQAATQALTTQAPHLPAVRAGALQAEIWLRATHPFALATGCFGLAFLFLLWRRFKACVPVTLGAGFAVLAVALAARVYILQRPPVGTLYESVVFVGLLVVGVALVMAAQDKLRRVQWWWLGATTGLALQLLGLRYAEAGRDSLGVLTAVLDTSFWLMTHVLVITLGYALALLAGGWGHVLLLQKIRQHKASKFTQAELKPLTLLLLAATAATATGTLLGGIWADQSWGRFWGWDPKENGALLLTLWLVWLLHARLSGVFSLLGLVVGAAATPVIVAVAWFGVNLLGVGLHSYGFAEGTFFWLVLFIVAEILFLTMAYLWLWKHR